MAIRCEAGRVALEGVCGVEEALPLLEAVQADPGAVVDLGGCTQLHSAALQVLMALAPPLAGPPAEPFVAALLAAAGLAPRHDPPPPAAPPAARRRARSPSRSKQGTPT